MKTDEIVECRIHPGVGVARVGNSPSEYFIGPEVPGYAPNPDGGFHDAAGRIKRQAARFRIYGLNADGQVVKELTAADAEITWRVQLANKKAAWYNFDLSMDIPEAKGELNVPRSRGPTRSLRRNAGLAVGHPEQLIIDSGPRRIQGPNVNADGGDLRYHFNQGRFLDITVQLGEVRTDETGRLVVLGGFGDAGSSLAIPRINSTRNNDFWYDDVSDWPVTATVAIGGRMLTAAPAWVAAVPPNFSPAVRSIVSIYDWALQAATQLDPSLRPVHPSFTRHIYPIFEAFDQNQWVNAGFLRDLGWQAAGNDLTPQNLDRLSDGSEENLSFREAIFLRFRDPAYVLMEEDALPPVYGDGFDLPVKDPRHWLAVTELQYEWLDQWSRGEFEADWLGKGPPGSGMVEELPLDAQPNALDRAALETCVGGSFNPGYDFPWIMRQPLLYESPFRIRHLLPTGQGRPLPARASGSSAYLREPEYGDRLTSDISLSPHGPLARSGPGDITRWMAIPWQADAASCTSAIASNDIYLPTFWPAGIPNDALPWATYQQVLDTNLDLETRREAFRNRERWFRDLSAFTLTRANQYVNAWVQSRIISPQPGPQDDPEFPDQFQVENE